MNIFKYQNYNTLLRDLLANHPKGGHGCQSRIAKKIRSQQSYLSRVINNKAELNTDQILAISQFFTLNKSETDYFLFLNLFNRCSNDDLKVYYNSKLQAIRSKELKISNRIEEHSEINDLEMATYYSDWSYQAVHVATAVKEYQTIDALVKRFDISKRDIINILSFLIKIGLVVNKNNLYKSTQKSLHLNDDSRFIKQFHRNWRLKSMEKLNSDSDLNYASVVSCSHSDAEAIQEIMIEAINKIRKIVKTSKDEDVYLYNLGCSKI